MRGRDIGQLVVMLSFYRPCSSVVCLGYFGTSTFFFGLCVDLLVVKFER